MLLDYRSDTFTKPTRAMRAAMASAEVGDDVYGEDPTVNELEAFTADYLGKESALFLPTCTMANLIATMVHCNGRFSEFIIGDQQHIHKYEVGGVSTVANVHTQLLPNLLNGRLDLELVAKKIREDDIHYPVTRMIAVENTHNMCGGKVLPLQYLNELRSLVDSAPIKYGAPEQIRIHMDGARFFNAAVKLHIESKIGYEQVIKSVAKPVDSVALCLSKGLCAPLGAVLVGEKQFIKAARHCRKALGGGMRQAGVVAACGLIALKVMSKPARLNDDHIHCQKLAAGINDISKNAKGNMQGCYSVIGFDNPEEEKLTTNMIYINVKDGRSKELVAQLKSNYGIVIDDSYTKGLVRMVTHNDVPIENVDYVIDSFKKVARTLFK